MTNNRIRVLVAAESPLLAEAIGSLIKACEGLEVIGEAADGNECVERACSLEPDVVVVDMAMKVMNGFEVTRTLSRRSPKTKVMILVDRTSQDVVVRTFFVGARGCVPNTVTSAGLAQAIRVVHSGDIYLHPSLTKTFVDAFLGLAKIETLTNAYEQLTGREKQVLRLVAEDRTSREIAGDLNMALKTVLGHRANLMKKLGIHSRAELVKYAIRRGIIKLES